jgi:outer membrane immunogenic protein
MHCNNAGGFKGLKWPASIWRTKLFRPSLHSVAFGSQTTEIFRNLLLIASIAAAAFCGAPALAADMPTKAPPLPPPTPAVSWIGFYIGANAGYGWGVNNSVFYTNITTGVTGTAPGPDGRGGFGGAQIGYNWQTGAVVLGLEADIQDAGIGSTVTGILPLATTTIENQKFNWFGTVRGRVGYAFDRMLVYLTGGYAGGHVSDTAFLSGGGATDLLTGSTQRNGFTIGGGLEYVLAKNWSAKAEYQYIDFGRETLFGVATNGNLVNTSGFKDSFNTVCLGLNYHFN